MVIIDEDWIIKFLSGENHDYKGRTYQNIIDCTDIEMELCHDQVQWIFPLHEVSNFAATYPIINREIVYECKNNPKIIENLTNAIKRMKDFYGLDPQNREKQRSWCKEFDHNLLRITRIIRCARIFGLDDEADEFYTLARDAADFYCIGNVTKAYWWRARYEDLYKSLK